MKYYFSDLAIGTLFNVDGVPYRKKSSRTAWTAPGHPAHAPHRWFWFGQRELVSVE